MAMKITIEVPEGGCYRCGGSRFELQSLTVDTDISDVAYRREVSSVKWRCTGCDHIQGVSQYRDPDGSSDGDAT